MSNVTDIHIGKEIRRVVEERGISMKRFADLLCCERNSLYYMFSQPSIDIKRLLRISDILHYDFLSLYTYENQLHSIENDFLGIVRLPISAKADFMTQYPTATIVDLTTCK